MDGYSTEGSEDVLDLFPKYGQVGYDPGIVSASHGIA